MKTVYAVVVALLASTAALRAQELQVPLHGDLEVIDAALASKLGLFADVPGFREARLFQAADGTHVLEIVQRLDGSTLKQRRPLTATGVATLRADIAAAFDRTQPALLRNDRGRTGFLVWTFALSYGFYSWAVPVTLDLSGSGAQALALGIGSAGFIVPFRSTRHTSVSRSHEALSVHGGRMGALYGLALSEIMLGDANDLRPATGLALAGSLGGLTGGFRLAGRTDWSAGTSQMLGYGGTFGFAMGAGGANLLGLWDHDRRRPGPALMLAGAGAGYWLAQRLTAAQPYTRGDGDVVALTGVLGAYLGVGSLVVAGVDDAGKAFTAAAMTGALAGVASGDRWIRDRDFSAGQSRLLTLGTVAGLLLGGATAVVVDAGEQVGTALSMAGGAAGFAATFRSLSPEAHADGDDDAAWHLGLDPLRRQLVVWWRPG